MLVLSRKLNEEIVIDRTIRVRLLKTGRGRVRLGVSAPRETPVQRAELVANESPEFPKRKTPSTCGAVTNR